MPALPPSQPDTCPSRWACMQYTPWLFCVHTSKDAPALRQVVYTLPRWRALVWGPLRSSGVQPWLAAATLAAFGAAYNVHAWVQAKTFAEEGAVAVGLANAVRCALPSSALACEGAQSSRSAERAHA